VIGVAYHLDGCGGLNLSCYFEQADSREWVRLEMSHCLVRWIVDDGESCEANTNFANFDFSERGAAALSLVLR